MMGNRRAVTQGVIRDNSIYGINILENGYFKKVLLYHHTRKINKARYTGPVQK